MKSFQNIKRKVALTQKLINPRRFESSLKCHWHDWEHCEKFHQSNLYAIGLNHWIKRGLTSNTLMSGAEFGNRTLYTVNQISSRSTYIVSLYPCIFFRDLSYCQLSIAQYRFELILLTQTKMWRNLIVNFVTIGIEIVLLTLSLVMVDSLYAMQYPSSLVMYRHICDSY